MSWNRNSIFQSLQLTKKQRIWSCYIPCFYKVRSSCSSFEFCNFKPSHLFLLGSWEFLNFLRFFLRFVLFTFFLLSFWQSLSIYFLLVKVFFCFFLMFFKDSFKVVVIFASQNVLVLLNNINDFNIHVILFTFGLEYVLLYYLFLMKKLLLMLFLSLLLLFAPIFDGLDLFCGFLFILTHYSYNKVLRFI